MLRPKYLRTVDCFLHTVTNQSHWLTQNLKFVAFWKSFQQIMDECLPRTGGGIAGVFTLVAQHVATLIVLVFWIRMSHRTVELAHPMYRLLHQEMVVLALFSSANTIILLTMTILGSVWRTTLFAIYMVVNFASLQFHQVTCLSVACIR